MFSDPEVGYLTAAIETDIEWPDKERAIEYRGHKFVVLPADGKRSNSIRVQLGPGFPRSVAEKMLLELLSALAWAEQRGARVVLGNWCTAPLNVGGGSMSATRRHGFAYLPEPTDAKARLALALYREGLSINLHPYKFLAFFKVINVIRNLGSDQKNWISENLKHVAERAAKIRVEELQKSETDVAHYLYVSGRCAVAHAFDLEEVVNPDDPVDLVRLHEDLSVICELARIAIEREFGVKSERVPR